MFSFFFVKVLQSNYYTDLPHVVSSGLKVKLWFCKIALLWSEKIAPMLMSLSTEIKGRAGWPSSLQTCVEAGKQTPYTISSSNSSDTVLFAMPICMQGRNLWERTRVVLPFIIFENTRVLKFEQKLGVRSHAVRGGDIMKPRPTHPRPQFYPLFIINQNKLKL